MPALRSNKGKLSLSYYVMAQALPFLLFKGLAEHRNEFIQFLGMATQEVLYLLDILQAVVCRDRTQLNWQTEFHKDQASISHGAQRGRSVSGKSHFSAVFTQMPNKKQKSLSLEPKTNKVHKKYHFYHH